MKFGEILALKYNVNYEDINAALKMQLDENFKDLKIGEILKFNKIIDDVIINEVLEIQKKDEPNSMDNEIVSQSENISIEQNVLKEVENIEVVKQHVVEDMAYEVNNKVILQPKSENIEQDITTQSEQTTFVKKDAQVLVKEDMIDENSTKGEISNEDLENICVKNIEASDLCVKVEPKEFDYKNMKIGEILNKKFGIARAIIDEGLSKQKKIFKDNKKKLGSILTEDGLISRDVLYHAYALQKNIKYLNYNRIKQRIDFKIYKDERIYKSFDEKSYIPLLYTIMKAKAIPMYWEINEETKNDILVIGITELDVNEAHILIDTIKKHLEKQNIEVEVCMTSDKLFSDFELKYKELTLEELEFFSKKIDEISAETFLKYLLVYSILHGVSDIHISPSSHNYARIATRIFGDVETLFYIPLTEYNKLISVVKNNADMKADKMRVPQDGRIDGKKLLKNVVIEVNRTNDTKNDYGINENRLEYNFEHVSFRVSSYPTEAPYELGPGQSFEKVVIRVLNLSSGLVELSELGLNKQITSELNYAKTRNQGIIFIVGPTGSGKSTTIYSALSSLNAIKKNIISFEDPVEMRQLYWSQGQRNVVKDNEDMNFDYLQSKKSILRQDPDIILMGEIRDEDSARFAIEAANTGHLVFTTLHSNSAAAAFERIKKLGVIPLEIASATLCILSQRLVKEVCSHCKKLEDITEEQIATLKRLEYKGEIPEKVIETNKNGCLYCNHRGYVGRSTLAEIIPINSKIKETIVNERPDYEIREMASTSGFKTILEDGIEKMNQGLVSLEDILNII